MQIGSQQSYNTITDKIESMQILIPLMFSDSQIDEDVDSIEVYKKVKELYKTFSKDDNGNLITGNEFLKLPEVKQFHDEFNFTTVNEEKTEANDNDNNKTNNTSRKEKKAKKKKNKNPGIDESNDYDRSKRKNKERDKVLTQQRREARKAKRTH